MCTRVAPSANEARRTIRRHGYKMVPEGGPECRPCLYRCAEATTTHSRRTPAEQAATGVTDGYVRLSVAIEHIDDILADIDQALAAAVES